MRDIVRVPGHRGRSDVHSSDAGEAPAGAPTRLTARQMYAPSNGTAPLRVGRLYRHHSYGGFPTSGGQVHDDVLPLDLLQQKLLLRRTTVVDVAGDALHDVVDVGGGDGGERDGQALKINFCLLNCCRSSRIRI